MGDDLYLQGPRGEILHILQNTKETGRYRHKAKYRISVKLDQEGNDSVNWASAFIVWYQASWLESNYHYLISNVYVSIPHQHWNHIFSGNNNNNDNKQS